MKAFEAQTPSIFCNLKVSKVEICVFGEKSDLRRVDKDAGPTLEGRLNDPFTNISDFLPY